MPVVPVATMMKAVCPGAAAIVIDCVTVTGPYPDESSAINSPPEETTVMALANVLQGALCAQFVAVFASLPVLETNAREVIACDETAEKRIEINAVRTRRVHLKCVIGIFSLYNLGSEKLNEEY